MSIPSWTSPRASARTLPISRVMARARRSLCSAMRAPKRYRISPRLGAGVAFQAGRAASAARIAITTSAAEPAWKRPTTSRISAGFTLSNVAPETPSTQRPAMNSWYVAGGAAVPDIGTSSRDQRGMEIDSMPAARCSRVADDASTGVPGVGRAAARDRRFRRRARGRDPPRPCSCQCRRLSQTRSKAMATDPPPPRHSVAMPYRPPRRCSSWSSVATIRAPDAPIG